MKCTKTGCYKSRREGLRVLKRFPATTAGKVPVRVYWCPEHKAFHVTSQPARKGN